jgi:hypothetical protein
MLEQPKVPAFAYYRLLAALYDALLLLLLRRQQHNAWHQLQ